MVVPAMVLDLGIGILASIAFDPARDKHLRAIDTGSMFPEKTTFLAMRKGETTIAPQQAIFPNGGNLFVFRLQMPGEKESRNPDRSVANRGVTHYFWPLCDQNMELVKGNQRKGCKVYPLKVYQVLTAFIAVRVFHCMCQVHGC